MNKQDRLMEYLYGEMSGEERAAFERELSCDPSLRDELEAMRRTREMLAGLPEVEPAARVLRISNPVSSWKRWGIRAGVAAAVLLLLLAFNARLEWTGRGLVFALGQPSPERAAPEAGTDPDAMIAALGQLLERREQEMDARLQSLDSAWQHRLLRREEALRRDWQDYRAQFGTDQQEQLARWEKDFQPELVALIQQTQLEQQRELRLLLNDFYAEWQQTRKADLESIEQEFVNLYRNVEYNQQEMEAILEELGRVGD
jgi:hypothetical protein